MRHWREEINRNTSKAFNSLLVLMPSGLVVIGSSCNTINRRIETGTDMIFRKFDILTNIDRYKTHDRQPYTTGNINTLKGNALCIHYCGVSTYFRLELIDPSE